VSEAGKTNNLAGQSRALTRVCDIVCNVQLFYSVLKAGRHAESTVEFRIRAPSHPAGSSPWAPRNIVPVALLAYSHLPMQPCRALRPSDLSSRGLPTDSGVCERKERHRGQLHGDHRSKQRYEQPKSRALSEVQCPLLVAKSRPFARSMPTTAYSTHATHYIGRGSLSSARPISRIASSVEIGFDDAVGLVAIQSLHRSALDSLTATHMALLYWAPASFPLAVIRCNSFCSSAAPWQK